MTIIGVKWMDELITIGKLSKISGVSTRTIRHYEEIGLLSCAAKTETNYRLYGEEEIRKLEKILLFKSLRFSLGEIHDILSSGENQRIVDIFNDRLQNFEQKISELSRSKEILTAVTKIYKLHGLEYVNNYRLMKEMIGMNNVFVKIFNKLDLSLQIKILLELYRTGSLTPETLKEIGTEPGTRLLNELHMTIVKVLLNKVDRNVEKNIIVNLEKIDSEFADELKKAMFTFDDIAMLPDVTIEKWLKKCDDEELRIAFSESGKYVRNRILNNLSCERREKIKRSIKDSNMPSLDEVYVAMTNLVEILREMEVAEEIRIERFD